MLVGARGREWGGACPFVPGRRPRRRAAAPPRPAPRRPRLRAQNAGPTHPDPPPRPAGRSPSLDGEGGAAAAASAALRTLSPNLPPGAGAAKPPRPRARVALEASPLVLPPYALGSPSPLLPVFLADEPASGFAALAALGAGARPWAPPSDDDLLLQLLRAPAAAARLPLPSLTPLPPLAPLPPGPWVVDGGVGGPGAPAPALHAGMFPGIALERLAEASAEAPPAFAATVSGSARQEPHAPPRRKRPSPWSRAGDSSDSDGGAPPAARRAAAAAAVPRRPAHGRAVPAAAAAAGHPSPAAPAAVFRGVSRHRLTQRWEASLWLDGRQLYLGGFDAQLAAARAYDLAALACKGPAAVVNFPPAEYASALAAVAGLTKEEVVAHVRRGSAAFARGRSRHRGVSGGAGRWEARIGAYRGRKNVSFGVFDSEAEAARQYDRALVVEKGRAAKTNFPLRDYEEEAAEYAAALRVAGCADAGAAAAAAAAARGVGAWALPRGRTPAAAEGKRAAAVFVHEVWAALQL